MTIKIALGGYHGKMGQAIASVVVPPFILMPPFGLDFSIDFDVLIDFSVPEISMRYLAHCVKYVKKIVIGTTGFSADQRAAIDQAAKQIPVVFAPNMGIGVNIFFELIKKAALLLQKESVDIAIAEIHHRHKKDKPSGTALKMGDLIEQAHHSVEYTSIRAGDVVGDHTAMFVMMGERIELTHRASSRLIYAQGALRAAGFLARTSAPGLYSMQEVLNIIA